MNFQKTLMITYEPKTFNYKLDKKNFTKILSIVLRCHFKGVKNHTNKNNIQ